MMAAPPHSFRFAEFFQVPIFISYWLLAMFTFQILQAASDWRQPTEWGISYAILSELLVFITILVHEFGHGLMTRHLGGSIDKILLWPLGGICFSVMPRSLSVRDKVLNDLKIVVAGPATHLFQLPIWLTVLYLGFPLVDPLQFLNPFGHWRIPEEYSLLFFPSLMVSVLGFAISINVGLFIFNVFLPMYPLDASKIFTSFLQLALGWSPTATARALVAVSGTCSVAFLFYAAFTKSLGVSFLIGLMCLGETLQLKELLDANRLASHPLFAHASPQSAGLLRSQTIPFGGIFSGRAYQESSNRV